jgi:hypothetical protein
MATKKLCRHPKSRPYGTKGTENYCRPHDQCMVYDVNNKVARRKAKEQIKRDIKENE